MLCMYVHGHDMLALFPFHLLYCICLIYFLSPSFLLHPVLNIWYNFCCSQSMAIMYTVLGCWQMFECKI
uniref:Uncharacterized protein n=1 Tax=Arundo donax TaxID=35708 RepID=A0A0A8Y6N2_ARUDO